MAEQTESREQQQEQNGGTNGGQKAVRAAAIAAATGAAALAAKKALSSRDQSGEGDGKSKRGSSGDESMLVAMASSGWSAAKHSLLPFAEEAAGSAGEWVGRNGPDYLRDTIVPRFIDGFEGARQQSE